MSTPESLRASDVMSSPVLGIRPGDPVQKAAHKMAKHGVSALAVRDGKGRTVGVVSASDIVRYESSRTCLVMGEREYERLREEAAVRIGSGFHMERQDDEAVSEIMTPEVVAVPPEAAVGHVAWLMGQKRIHRVFVEKGGRVVGIVTALDVARALGRSSAPAGSAPRARQHAQVKHGYPEQQDRMDSRVAPEVIVDDGPDGLVSP